MVSAGLGSTLSQLPLDSFPFSKAIIYLDQEVRKTDFLVLFCGCLDSNEAMLRQR